MNNIKITTDTDFYKTPILIDITTGKRIRFEPVQVPGKGWSVARVTGSKRTGRTVERAEGFEDIDNYTMHQAQVAAENLKRCTWVDYVDMMVRDGQISESLAQRATL